MDASFDLGGRAATFHVQIRGLTHSIPGARVDGRLSALELKVATSATGAQAGAHTGAAAAERVSARSALSAKHTTGYAFEPLP